MNIHSAIHRYVRSNILVGHGLSCCDMEPLGDGLVTEIDEVVNNTRRGMLILDRTQRNAKLHLGFNLGIGRRGFSVNFTPMTTEQYERFNMDMKELDCHRKKIYRSL